MEAKHSSIKLGQDAVGKVCRERNLQAALQAVQRQSGGAQAGTVGGGQVVHQQGSFSFGAGKHSGKGCAKAGAGGGNSEQVRTCCHWVVVRGQAVASVTYRGSTEAASALMPAAE